MPPAESCVSEGKRTQMTPPFSGTLQVVYILGPFPSMGGEQHLKTPWSFYIFPILLLELCVEL